MRALYPTLAFVALLAVASTGFAVAEADEAAVAATDEAAVAVADADPPIGLETMIVCEDVAERVPVGEADSFPSSIGTLYCFTRVTTDEAPVQVFHRWYVGDQLIDEIPINVKGESWRCWSRKTILESWNGPCRVDILTEAGDVIGTREFKLETAEAAGSEG